MVSINRPSSQELITHLNMRPLEPEGGFFVETYRSPLTLSPTTLTGHKGDRCASTAILYLLPQNQVSTFHRLQSDEMWHFHMGDPITIVEIDEQGELITTIMSNNIIAGQFVQHVVPARRWFGAYLDAGYDYALLGCTVAPGFDYDDFEIASRAELLSMYPRHREAILKLTPRAE